VGYIASKPAVRVPRSHNATFKRDELGAGFLAAPTHTPDSQRLFDHDVEGVGYVTNLSRLWAYMPTTLDGLSDLMGQVTQAGSLTLRQRAVLVTAAASTLGDSYCSLAWGKKLATELGSEVAAAVIRGTDDDLDAEERALARWARAVATDPNAIEAREVQGLRDAGFDEAKIFAITTFVALRLAFSTINDALGAAPDSQLGRSTPAPVLSAVTFGRPLGPDHE
jgi:alkylhydroperoxidase family enzyme